MFLHGIRLNRCKRLLSREEEADLSFSLLVTGAAVKLIDRIILSSELRSEADGGRTHTSAWTAGSVAVDCSVPADVEASVLIARIKDFLFLFNAAFAFSTRVT